MILEEKHQKVAMEIAFKNRKKKSCNKCYDRGYIGFTPDKFIVPCPKCLDMDKAMDEWKAYVEKDEVLKVELKDLFEEENEQGEEKQQAEDNKE